MKVGDFIERDENTPHTKKHLDDLKTWFAKKGKAEGCTFIVATGSKDRNYTLVCNRWGVKA